MAFKIKGSHVVAVVIAAAIGGWMYTGNIVVGGQSSGEGAVSISEREAELSSKLFKVRYVRVQPQQRLEELVVRGRTQASAIVPVRAQVSGTLMERLVNKGDAVSADQIVCKVDAGARAAQLAQAEAQLANATVEYDSNSTLVKKGIVSKNRLKTLQASLDAAKAGIAEAKLNLERSQIRANASGIVQDPIAEVGDMLSVGGTCITLVQSDPMKFAGQISEREIDKVEVGSKASIRLVSGVIVEGTVKYISPSADAQTRTFLTEIDIANRDGKIRDGVTAQAKIELQPVEAYRLSPAWMTLSEDGNIGVRTVDEEGIIQFVELELIAQAKDGFWVRGLEPGTRVVTLGQEYVISGEKVEAVPEKLNTAEVSQ
ncbi:MAG: efflux RND transporter periplasmic adaptor subunit [Rhizobiaceae bacterium]|nr:efflux RND transporter periplasmic adaptor subunit [Rhizobiaceae bacterium]